MGKAASTTWPITLCVGQLRNRISGTLDTLRFVTSPNYTLHVYVDEQQPLRGLGKTLCGKQMVRNAVVPGRGAWLFRKVLPKTECASCQRLQGSRYGTHGS